MEIPTISVNFSNNTMQYTTYTTLVDGFEEKQRKFQKKREERELEERRKQKERIKEALEEYAKYRRDLRRYYIELGFQKNLEASMGGMATFIDVKMPKVSSDVYKVIMMLGM